MGGYNTAPMNAEYTITSLSRLFYRSISAISLRRWVLLISGLCCFGFGIALMVQAGLGLSPWESLHQGISIHTGIPIGTVSILLGVPILALWLPLGERPGIGTLFNVVCIGLVTNVSLPVLPRFTQLGLQLMQMALGILVIGAGSGLYLSSQLGAGPRDGLMMGLTRRTGWSVRVTRTAIELGVLAVAFVLGGSIGIGTVAFALGIGPVVQLMFRILGMKAVRRKA
ncbi:MAG: YitT family protein [Chloroflexi bacterium]|nr:YitT family protein [Chloroflexota bacterium]